MAIDCAVCQKSIGRYDDYIACRHKCLGSYHIECVQISIAEFTQMKEDGAIRSWKCNSCKEELTSKSIQPEMGELSSERVIQELIGKQLNKMADKIISSFKAEIVKLRNDNKNLMEELNFVKQQLGIQKSSQNELPKSLEVTTDTTTQKISGISDKSIPVPESNNTNSIRYEQAQNYSLGEPTKFTKLKYSALAARQKLSTSENVQTHTENNESMNQSQKKGVLKVGQNNNNKKNGSIKVIRGTATNATIQGTIQYAHLHVCGLHPNTTIDSIIEYMKSKSFDNVKCEKLQAKRPDEYASFKVSLPLESLDDARQPELWPTGVRLNRFLERIYKKRQPT